ncbi:MAG: Zn-dependent protease [Chthoniobacter sp.]|jgi:Zn-dependent protease|nr:Zn-dependent protease [Chthoniobacter sp.]
MLLVCPACGTLVHAEELKELATRAEAAEDPAQALTLWREAHGLLPVGSRQQEVIASKIDALVRVVDRHPLGGGKKHTSWGKVAAGAGVVALFLAKFKFVLLFLATKGKLLFLGLTKAGTFFSMFLSFGLYWSIWGWKFAAGLVLSIYVHEMGHVAMLMRLGVKAGMPMFIPGLGAVIRLRENLPTAREDARVGLAGPIWGLGAAVTAYLLGIGLQAPVFLAIAKIGAWINLFNLAPVWQLDGSRAFRSLTRQQRWIAFGSIIAALLLAQSEAYGMLIIVALFAAVRLFEKAMPAEPDHRALIEYVVLVAAHSTLASIPVPR